jgi:ABC-type phosphate transport system auxiliary subunit
MDIENGVKAVEAEVVAEAKKVEEVVVSEAEKIKASALAQKADFQKQYEQVKKDMANLQQQFEAKKIIGVRLEGAIESLEILLKNLLSK